MKSTFAGILNWRSPISRCAYFCSGILLAALKYNIDRFLVWRSSGERWSLLDYTKAGEYLWPRVQQFDSTAQLSLMLAIAAPFMAIGVLLTVKRLQSARLNPWLVLLFFVPVVKLFLFVLLCLAPDRSGIHEVESRGENPKHLFGFLIPRSAWGSALAGIVGTTALSAIGVWLGTSLVPQYGWSLFVGVPFGLGFLSVLVFGYHSQRSLASCLVVSILSAAAAGLALLLVAVEGLICIFMAAPLAVPMAMVGACAAFHIQTSDWWQGRPARLLCVAALVPLLMIVEHWQPAKLPLLSVRTSVQIAASPEKVWQHVVSFSELPPPQEFIFRLGIAYPIRARIFGSGVGAERHCEFSTGPFIEPIMVWDAPTLLKFSVTSNPEPMQEWTPYRDLHPRHLDGFLESRAGQFRLERLPDGSTILEGTTWYYHHMWPAWYWQKWSDYIIHKIHLRVLRHVKALAEAPLPPNGS